MLRTADAELSSQTATVEYIRGPFNHPHSLCAPLGLRSPSLKLVLQRKLGGPIAIDVPRLAGPLDVDQQIHQAGGALSPLPCRFPPVTRIHLVRLVPWRYQGLRFIQP